MSAEANQRLNRRNRYDSVDQTPERAEYVYFTGGAIRARSERPRNAVQVFSKQDGDGDKHVVVRLNGEDWLLDYFDDLEVRGGRVPVLPNLHSVVSLVNYLTEADVDVAVERDLYCVSEQVRA